jgi:hypothetical protein
MPNSRHGFRKGCGAEFRRLSKSQKNREVGRSAFGQPVVEKAREGFSNGLLIEDKKKQERLRSG